MNSNSLYVGLHYHEICGLNSKVYINLLKLCTESCGLFFPDTVHIGWAEHFVNATHYIMRWDGLGVLDLAWAKNGPI